MKMENMGVQEAPHDLHESWNGFHQRRKKLKVAALFVDKQMGDRLLVVNEGGEWNLPSVQHRCFGDVTGPYQAFLQLQKRSGILKSNRPKGHCLYEPGDEAEAASVVVLSEVCSEKVNGTWISSLEELNGLDAVNPMVATVAAAMLKSSMTWGQRQNEAVN